MRQVVQHQFGTGRASSIMAIGLGATVGIIVFAAAVTVLAGVRPSTLLSRTAADV